MTKNIWIHSYMHQPMCNIVRSGGYKKNMRNSVDRMYDKISIVERNWTDTKEIVKIYLK